MEDDIVLSVTVLLSVRISGHYIFPIFPFFPVANMLSVFPDTEHIAL